MSRVRDIGDRIAALDWQEAWELYRYLRDGLDPPCAGALVVLGGDPSPTLAAAAKLATKVACLPSEKWFDLSCGSPQGCSR